MPTTRLPAPSSGPCRTPAERTSSSPACGLSPSAMAAAAAVRTPRTSRPAALDGVSVTINGEPAYLSYVSPVQINLLTPADLPSSGQVTVVVTDNTLTSSTVNVSPQAVAPSFFLLDTAGHIAATHANNT